MTTPNKPRTKNRINTGITILPDLLKALQAQAQEENRTASRLLEILLQWSLDQMKEHKLQSTQLKFCKVRVPDL